MSHPTSSPNPLWFTETLVPGDIYQHRINTVIEDLETAYQHLLIVDTVAHGRSLILDNRWQASVADEFLYHEPLVHPACVFHREPRKVLILGGGDGAALREVLRWKCVDQTVLVEIDQQVLDACRKHLGQMHQDSFDAARTEIIVGDAMAYLDHCGQLFDIVICDLSDPTAAGPSFKFFTKEYFAQVQRVLRPDGIFTVQAGSLSLHEMNLHVRLVKTLSTVFESAVSYHSYVPSFVSAWGFAMASAQHLDPRPDPDRTNEILRRQLVDDGRSLLRMFDGTTLLGMLQQPRHIRTAIAQEPEVFTLAKPPQVMPAR